MDRTKYSRMLKDSSIPSSELQQEKERLQVEERNDHSTYCNQVARFCAVQIIIQEETGNKNKN
jgi:hypothetical protein